MVPSHDNAALFELVYPVLRDLASSLLGRERRGHTLQPTALVNEAFVKLQQAEKPASSSSKPEASQPCRAWNGKTHFQAVASRAMRQILVDHARSKAAQKRGGDWQRVTMSGGLICDDRDVDFEALDEAMQLLEQKDERKCRVVELRFFGGMTCVEIANELSVSPKTVEADWYFARAWLRKQLQEGDE